MKNEDSGSVEEDDLFVRIGHYEDRQFIYYDWYKLDEEKEESSIVSPSFKLTQPDCHYRSGQVSVGPFIFVIGGESFQYQKMYRDVFVIDTRNPDSGWKKGPKLLTARDGAYPFVLGNTICAFGGQWINSHPHGEVLDLETGIWKWFKTAIDTPAAPPYCIYSHVITYKDEDEGGLFGDDYLESDYAWYEYNTAKRAPPYPKELYVHGGHHLCSYNFDNGKWKVINDSIYSSAIQSASVGDVLYVLNPELTGYSVKKGIWFDVSLSAFGENYLPPRDEYDEKETPPACLVHLGNGILCLLWANSKKSNNDMLHCTKFTIEFHITDDGKVSATAEFKTFNTYKIPPGRLVDCVTVSNSTSTSTSITFPFVK